MENHGSFGSYLYRTSGGSGKMAPSLSGENFVCISFGSDRPGDICVASGEIRRIFSSSWSISKNKHCSRCREDGAAKLLMVLFNSFLGFCCVLCRASPVGGGFPPENGLVSLLGKQSRLRRCPNSQLTAALRGVHLASLCLLTSDEL